MSLVVTDGAAVHMSLVASHDTVSQGVGLGTAQLAPSFDNRLLLTCGLLVWCLDISAEEADWLVALVPEVVIHDYFLRMFTLDSLKLAGDDGRHCDNEAGSFGIVFFEPLGHLVKSNSSL